MDFTNVTNRIKPTDKSLLTYFEELREGKYQIPTFQRDVVWESERVKKLWDSIYKFYPLGSVLVWNTDMKLQNHRDIGGFVIPENVDSSEYHYILDGQQRTTSLFTSLDENNKERVIYVDLTVSNKDETDDETYKEKFLFWSDIDDKDGTVKRNVSRLEKYRKGLIVKLVDVIKHSGDLQNNIFKLTNDFNSTEMQEFLKIQNVINNYKLSFIDLRGIKVSEVCQIFERINQAGKPLDIFDIVVAKTFVPKTETDKGFYLRELIDDFREKNDSNFMNISDLDYLQILAVLIRIDNPNSGVQNITNIYLNEIKTEYITAIWEDAKTALLNTFKFFENYLHLQPYLIPYRYLYMTVTAYFFRNKNPDYDFLIKYFWYYSFHSYDLLSNTTHLHRHIDNMKIQREKGVYPFETFVFDKQKLRSSKYSATGRFCSAILSLYTNKEPRDWSDKVVKVQVANYFATTDKPQLHHVFPTNSKFVHDHPNENQNSLMNIAFITQSTNLKISNRDPNDYLKDFGDEKFSGIMAEHFLPHEFVDLCGAEKLPNNALSVFIEKRIELIEADLREKLKGIEFQTIDTKTE